MFNIDLDKIKTKKIKKFKKELNLVIRKRAFEYLTDQITKKKMTKINDIHYKKLELQKYLESAKIFTHRKKLLFKIRTKMIKVKSIKQQVQIIEKINSISLFITELLQLNDALKIELRDLVGHFTIYVCAY